MNPFSTLAPADFTGAGQRLLPRGAAWPRDPDATLTALTAALAARTAAVHARAAQLLEVESDPTQTVEMLSDWETAYGLPDPCTPLNPTLQQRRFALLAKIIAIGGQSIGYYQSVAAALGYAITITEFHAFVADDPCELPDNDPSWDFAWQVNAPETTEQLFRADVSAADEPLATWGNAQLECVLNRLKPADTILTFAYPIAPGLLDSFTLDVDVLA